MPKKGVTKSGG